MYSRMKVDNDQNILEHFLNEEGDEFGLTDSWLSHNDAGNAWGGSVPN